MASPQIITLGVPTEAAAAEVKADCCGNCTAFYPQPKLGGKVGQCRREPPKPIITAFLIESLPDGKTIMVPARGIDGAWPATGIDLHCQQYRRRGLNGLAPLPLTTTGESEPVEDEGS